MMLLRGKGRALEIGCAERDLAAVCDDLRGRFAERPDFYRGSRAKAIFGATLPSVADLERLREALAEYEVSLDGILGDGPLAEVAAAAALAYLGPAPADGAPPKRRRIRREPRLSEAARSLVADFAGARSDLAARRTGPLPRPAEAPGAAIPAPRIAAGPATLYHRGTLRGGQALHQVGNIVVLGDVNPGAELVATGDIVVVGALRGVAHAGAQGDLTARVVALELAPTQLRIATLIAAGEEPGRRRGPSGPEHAVVAGDRIVIVPHARAELSSGGVL